MTDITRESVKTTLKAMWLSNLSTKQFSDNSDFFELGGDSMGVVSILAKIYETFDVKISLEEFLFNRSFSAQFEIIYRKLS